MEYEFGRQSFFIKSWFDQYGTSKSFDTWDEMDISCVPEDFYGRTFPATIVTAMTVGGRMEPYQYLNPSNSWDAYLYPGTIPLRVGKYARPLVFFDPFVRGLDGQPVVDAKADVLQFNEAEAFACGIEELIVSHTPKATKQPVFVSTNERCVYTQAKCNVKLRMKSWGAIPKCLEAFDHYHQKLNAMKFGNELPRPYRRPFAKDAAVMAGLARERFIMRACNAAIECGRFVSCALYFENDRQADLCVLQILREFTDSEMECRLHILTPESIKLDRNRLNLRCDYSIDRDKGRRDVHRELNTVLADILCLEVQE